MPRDGGEPLRPRKARVAVLVSGGGSNLQAILDAADRGEFVSGEVVLVISNSKDAYALERAGKHGIPARVITKGKRRTQAEFEGAILEALEEAEVDFIVLAGFLSILSADFVKRYPERIVNVHPSLIPSFCGKGAYGLRVHEQALAYGVKLTGATVHYVNEIPDGGKILAQKAVTVLPGDTPETLQRRVMEQAEWVLLPQVVEECCRAMVEDEGKGNATDRDA